ncbi:ribosomal L7Ae/L30e/S12e/Gadd45 family protein [Candidatus Bathyarchaeota archaeon]|jgi:large subunit ribosomal protein L30e|nr:ribosomal L7Ae/L30e/S12e/Gadd45 family protein [Candidatus Bathyarchaeota archaeon]
MIDVNRVIQSVLKSGRAFYGAHETAKVARTGRAAAIIVSSNCPSGILRTLETDSNKSAIPLLRFPGSSKDLGVACHKPFAVAALTIREIPEPDLAMEVKESLKEE